MATLRQSLFCAHPPNHSKLCHSSSAARGTFWFYAERTALSCASHETAQIHLDAVRTLQEKIGIHESDLQCGAHLPGDPEMLKKVIVENITPTANFNNCSGKHTAMLAHAKMRGLPLETYLERDHPIQQGYFDDLRGDVRNRTQKSGTRH